MIVIHYAARFLLLLVTLPALAAVSLGIALFLFADLSLSVLTGRPARLIAPPAGN